MSRPRGLSRFASLLNASDGRSLGFLDVASAATTVVLSAIRHDGVKRLVKFAGHFE